MVAQFNPGKVYRDGAYSYQVERRNADGTVEFNVDKGYTQETIKRRVTVCPRSQSERFWPFGDSRPIYAKA